MKRRVSVFVFIFCLFCVSFTCNAQAEGSVGLGVFIGAAFSQGSTSSIPSVDWAPSLNWGYYVNIPLVSTFHITPSSELYKLGDANATDFDIACKFIVPLSGFSFYAGFAPGLTAVREALDIHIGVLGGGSFTLVSNLDVFVQVKYTFIFDGDNNIKVLHGNAGLLFNF